jgi:membrane-associated phospholipid phosphatase
LVCIALGLAGLAIARRSRLPRSLPASMLCAGIVQAATIGTMMLGKTAFGRLRPQQLFESGDWNAIWFSAGGSFPSGHASFYFGLFLPLAASAPRIWQRVGLIVVPIFVALARIDMNRHFLSDVSASALVAAGWSLLVAVVIRRWRPAG